MVRKIIILAILFVLNLTFICGQHKDNLFAAQAPKQNNDKSADDYLRLRLDYSQSKEYDPYNGDVSVVSNDCAKLINEGKFKELVDKVHIGLTKDKYNIKFLMDLAIAYRKLGDIENADKYRKLWKGLMDSILTSGDGKSANTAFKVISVEEEYATLAVFGLKCVGQQLVSVGGKQFDLPPKKWTL